MCKDICYIWCCVHFKLQKRTAANSQSALLVAAELGGWRWIVTLLRVMAEDTRHIFLCRKDRALWNETVQ
jgi:hypothetical protein